MTKEEAYKILCEFQMWRRSEGKYRIQWNDLLHHEPQPFPYSPKEVSVALDVAIAALKKEVQQ